MMGACTKNNNSNIEFGPSCAEHENRAKYLGIQDNFGTGMTSGECAPVGLKIVVA